jgi:hypothetical protein
MTPSERHNALVREFIELAGRETSSMPELMAVIESVITAAMLLNVRLHGVRPHVATGLVEAAIHAATERFTEQMKGLSR